MLTVTGIRGNLVLLGADGGSVIRCPMTVAEGNCNDNPLNRQLSAIWRNDKYCYFWGSFYADWIKSGNIEDEGMFWGQKSNSAYAVVNMSMQFYHTWDEAYTRKVYPFVKGVATFWENYLTREGDRYVIYNDAIHEGTVGTMNPILSLGLVRMVMQTVSDMSALLGVDEEKRTL